VLQESSDYQNWLTGVKSKLRSVQLKAAVAVNSALLVFYWELGAEIVEKQKERTWGDGFLQQLSQDLMADFPEMKGFSKRNLEQIRRWYRFWSENEEFAKQLASQIKEGRMHGLFQIPWWHNVVILTKCRSTTEALYYVENTLNYGCVKIAIAWWRNGH
jgi:predicted nuclease of restriction endonuclease-like (RecB) superfamily